MCKLSYEDYGSQESRRLGTMTLIMLDRTCTCGMHISGVCAIAVIPITDVTKRGLRIAAALLSLDHWL
jgi:hypothetical protein